MHALVAVLLADTSPDVVAAPMNPYLIVLLTVVGLIGLKLLFFVVMGGNLKRLGLAWFGAFRVLRDADFADKVKTLLAAAPPPPPVPPKPSGARVRLLALLQRDSRFLDFFLAELGQAAPDQIAATVRALQPKAREALHKYLVLEPVVGHDEGATIDIPAGFDPSAIQLTGNITGKPPFRGVVLHPGWRVKEIRIPPAPEGQDEFVLAPAEVEIS